MSPLRRCGKDFNEAANKSKIIKSVFVSRNEQVDTKSVPRVLVGSLASAWTIPNTSQVIPEDLDNGAERIAENVEYRAEGTACWSDAVTLEFGLARRKPLNS